MQRSPGMLEIERIRHAPNIRGQPGIPANAGTIYFSRRVGSLRLRRGSSQGQKGAAPAVFGVGVVVESVGSEPCSGENSLSEREQPGNLQKTAAIVEAGPV